MKKAVAILIAAALCGTTAISFVGCGGNDGPQDTAETKVVRAWIHKSESEDEGKVYSAIADSFNEEQFKTDDGRTIRLRLEFYNDASTLATAIYAEVISGGLPDILAVDAPNIASYAEAELLTDISSYISRESLNDYVDSVVEQGTYNGGLYALSAMDAPTGLYYNKDLLKQVGYDDDDFGTISNPWSWTEVMEAMRTLKANGLSYKIKLNLGFGGDEGCMYLYSPLVYSSNGAFFGPDGKSTGYLDSDATINGIKMIEPFFEEDTDGEVWYYNGGNDDALAQGEVAFEVHGPWNITTIRKSYRDFVNSYDIMPMPVYVSNGVKGTAGAGCGSWCFGVTPYAKDKKAAAKVVEYFTSAYSSELLYESIGTFPTHKSSLANITDFQSGAARSLANILTEIATPRPVTSNYPNISEAFSDIIEYIETYYGSKDYNLKSYASGLCVSIDSMF